MKFHENRLGYMKERSVQNETKCQMYIYMYFIVRPCFYMHHSYIHVSMPLSALLKLIVCLLVLRARRKCVEPKNGSTDE